MEPPLPSGTILQNRYLVLSVLGQGGFGRTYLAEDQGRFNERCALKELIPPQTGDYLLDKSKELFQREATTLYQIKHPQIPQFRANFEQDGRLFLVQDYVEGKTYRELLNERLAQTHIQTPGQTLPRHTGVFSEAEARQLLQQLLPVLDHIHSKNIIHRDITPDNIIRRDSDGLPVLIDFGVVKELATRLHSPHGTAVATTVGKIGYAPSEQIQSGRAYPSSDLYSLAVTAVVLLTGKEPREMFDDNQLTWNWRPWANVSDDLANILNRMLSYRPGERYQSAAEVLQALQTGAAAPAPIPPPPVPTPPPPQRPDPIPSNMATMAVGRRPDPEPSSVRRPGRSQPNIPEPRTNSFWDNPWAVVGLAIPLALLAGLGSWALFSALNREQEPPIVVSPTETEPFPTPTETETPLPTPTATVTPTQTPTQTPPPSPTSFTQRLNVTPGTPVAEAGTLRANSTANYVVRSTQGQQLSATLNSEGVLMTVIGPDGNILRNGRRVTQWQGALPSTGDYTLQLRPVQGLQESDYRLALNLTETQEPTPTPTSSPQRTYQTRRVSFPDGQGRVTLNGTTSPQRIQRYVANLQEGQQLSINVPEGSGVSLEIRDPNGQVLDSGVVSWQGDVPIAGDYRVDVIANQQTDFNLDMAVE